MNIEKLKKQLQNEENIAHIRGWDFSHLDGRMVQEMPPWDYKEIIRKHLKPTDRLLDIDTGGGEFLLTLSHPYKLICATEGYKPNVELCRKKLIPLSIDFKEARDYSNLPFEDGAFDFVINRHGAYDIKELWRILKPNGIFLTQQVGEENDKELIELLLPNFSKPKSGMNLKNQTRLFRENGFNILEQNEAFMPMKFFDTGAIVWFARIIEWEFPNFSVENCFDRLLLAEEKIRNYGFVQTLTHRYIIAAQKKQSHNDCAVLDI